MQQLLQQAFDIKPGEHALVGRFFLLFVGVGMFYTVGATVGDTLLLASLPAERVPRILPWVYVGIAAGNIASTLAFDFVQARASRRAAIIGTQVAIALSVVATRPLVESSGSGAYFALAIWLEVCALLSITLSFSFAGEYFTPRSARRLYGVIAGGMSVGTVLSGWGIQMLVPITGTRDLIYVGTAVLILNAGLSLLISRRHPTIHDDVGADEPGDGSGEAGQGRVALGVIFERPYVRLLALMIPLSIVMAVAVDYQMKWLASGKDEAHLAQFFGSFYFWVGAAQIVFQFLVVPRLLARLGIVNCLTVLPLVLGAASAVLYSADGIGLGSVGLLMLSAGVNFLRLTLAETLDLPSRELLFLPLPSRIRARTQPLMGGALAPAAQGLGGVLLLGALTMQSDARTLSMFVILCAMLLLLTLVKLRPRYQQTLAETLREHQLDATDIEQILASPDAEALLEQLLRSRNAEVIKSTYTLLSDRELGPLGAVIAGLAQSRDTDVAVGAIRRLVESRDPHAEAAVARAWESDRPALRQAAVLAHCELNGAEALTLVTPVLDSEDHELRVSAIVGIARHCGEDGSALIAPQLRALAESGERDERMQAAELIGKVGEPGHGELLSSLLRDDLRAVRLAAADACASVGDPDVVDALLAIDDPDLQPAVLRALAATPPAAAAALVAIVVDPGAPTARRSSMIRVLGRVGGERAIEALWSCVRPGGDLLLRVAATESLRQLGRAESRPSVADEAGAGVDPYLLHLCDRIELLAAALREVRDDAFVRSVMADDAHLHAQHLLCLCAVLYDAERIERVEYNLLGGTGRERIRALELFENILPRRLARRAANAMQTWIEAEQQTQPSDGLSEATRGQLLDAGSWLRVVTVRHLNQGAAYPTVEAERLDDMERELYQRLDIVSFLKDVPLFRGLKADYLLEQAEIAEWTALGEGERLFEDGDRGDELFIICQGELAVMVDDAEVARLSAGECIGDLALLDGQPRSAAVDARTDASLLRISGQRFKALLVTEPAIARAMLRALDFRIRTTQGGGTRAADGSSTPPPQRRTRFMQAQKLNLHELVSTMSFLRKVDLFGGLSTPAIANLAGIAAEVLLFEDELLFEQGSDGGSLYIVTGGELAIVVDGREVARVQPGACIGEMALISGLPRSATARATCDARLLRLGADEFDTLLLSEPEIGLALLRTLALRLRTATRA